MVKHTVSISSWPTKVSHFSRLLGWWRKKGHINPPKKKISGSGEFTLSSPDCVAEEEVAGRIVHSQHA